VLLLCSASPRRRDFLRALGLRFESLAPHVDEARRPGEAPAALAERLARSKAAAGMRAYRLTSQAPAVALGADTVVALGERDLAKPADRADAVRMLRALSGRVHRVITGVCVAASAGADEPSLRSLCVETDVRFHPLPEPAIEWLAASGDGDDKAGAYAVQGLAGAFIDRIEGSFTNVVGLPMTEAIALLAEAGVPMPWEEQ
jgi:septum formation protein